MIDKDTEKINDDSIVIILFFKLFAVILFENYVPLH